MASDDDDDDDDGDDDAAAAAIMRVMMKEIPPFDRRKQKKGAVSHILGENQFFLADDFIRLIPINIRSQVMTCNASGNI